MCKLNKQKFKKWRKDNNDKHKEIECSKIFWKLHNIILCWVFLNCVNNNQDIDVKHSQIMYCMFCYNDLLNAFNQKAEARKGLISYYKKD